MHGIKAEIVGALIPQAYSYITVTSSVWNKEESNLPAREDDSDSEIMASSIYSVFFQTLLLPLLLLLLLPLTFRLLLPLLRISNQ